MTEPLIIDWTDGSDWLTGNKPKSEKPKPSPEAKQLSREKLKAGIAKAMEAVREKAAKRRADRKAKAAFCPGASPPDNSCPPANKGEGVSETAVAPAPKKSKPVDKQIKDAARREMKDGSGKAISTNGRSQKLVDAVTSFENKNQAAQKLETAVIYDQNGGQLLRKKGVTDHVHMDAGETSLIRLQGNATLTHNHPNGSPFSVGDLGYASYANLAEIRAFGNEVDKVVHYSMRRPKDGWPEYSKMNEEIWKAAKDVEADYIMKYGADDVNASAHHALVHSAWVQLANKIGAEYQRQYE